MVGHLFFLSLRILWRLYNLSLRMIDALASLSNNILIVYTLEFSFSSEFTGLIWEFDEILPRSLGGKITPKVIGVKSVELIDCSLFNFYLLLGWLTKSTFSSCSTRRDLVDMWFKLVLIKRYK